MSGAGKLWTSQNEWGTPCFLTSHGSLLSLNLGHFSLFTPRSGGSSVAVWGVSGHSAAESQGLGWYCGERGGRGGKGGWGEGTVGRVRRA